MFRSESGAWAGMQKKFDWGWRIGFEDICLWQEFMEQIHNQSINHGRIPCPVGIVKQRLMMRNTVPALVDETDFSVQVRTIRPGGPRVVEVWYPQNSFVGFVGQMRPESKWKVRDRLVRLYGLRTGGCGVANARPVQCVRVERLSGSVMSWYRDVDR